MLGPPHQILGLPGDPNSAGKGVGCRLVSCSVRLGDAPCENALLGHSDLQCSSSSVHSVLFSFSLLWSSSGSPIKPPAQSDNFHMAEIQDLCKTHQGIICPQTTPHGVWVQPFATQKSSHLKTKKKSAAMCKPLFTFIF